MACREYRRICSKRRVWAPLALWILLLYIMRDSNPIIPLWLRNPGAGQPPPPEQPQPPPPQQRVEGAPVNPALLPMAATGIVIPAQPPPPPPLLAPAATVALPAPAAEPVAAGGGAGGEAAAPLTQELMDSMSEPAKRAYAASLNTAQHIFNSEKLPQPLGSSPIIVVMVHNRPKYFQAVLRSLERVRGIEKALLVVSLDYLSPELDSIIRSIKFCAVVQLFCSASQQLFPTQFPGTDPRDCAGGWDSLKKHEAKAIGCLNWATPDQYGHYREAKFVAVKHHWFWQFNFLFQKLRVASATDWTGYAFYMEEDHYAAPDTLSVLAQMVDIAQTQCGEEKCGLLNLGLKVQEAVSDDGSNFDSRGHTLSVAGWESPKHNMGMAFNRHFWDKMQRCASNFCAHDDYK